MTDYSSELQQLAKAYEQSGGDPANLQTSDSAIRQSLRLCLN